jgi:uncharacterized iron-regulated membrane protein
MKLRTVVFWPHLLAGVLAGTVIVIMSATGVILTYERQIIAWSDSHLRSAPPTPGAKRMSVEALLESAQQHHPDLVTTGITLGSAPDATAVLATSDGNRHLDAYTGRLLGESATGVRQFMSSVRAWHRWLAVEGEGRPLARAITGWSNLLFLFIVVSGAYLWIPRKWSWSQIRSVALFNGKLRGKARDFNWHNVIGVWSVVPLFIVVISAVPISFPWGTALVYRAVGEQPPAPAARGRGAAAAARGGAPASTGREHREAARPVLAGLDALWARAEQRVAGWRTINLRLPASDRTPVVFAIDSGDGGQPHRRSTLTLDRQTGEVVSYEDFSSLTLGRRIRNTMRFAHTGEVIGLPGQTIAGLATFGSLVLVWTGLSLAWRRLRAWTRRRREPVTAVASDAAAA